LEEGNFSERLEKLEAHARYWSFYLGPLGEEARMKREAALEKEYERLAGHWEVVAEESRPKMREDILKAYKTYQDALSERWDDMLVLDLAEPDDWHEQREHRWEMEREVAKDPAYALRLSQKFSNLGSEQSKDQ
jgi:hypothetical protein